MSLAKSAFLIRDYDNIREILRDVYIFGCYSRDDFIGKGISGRKYDNEQRRISAYLPEKFIQKRRMGKKVLLYCTYKADDSANNYLAETYRNKSFTLLDVMSYFFILQILSDETARSLPEILDELPAYNDEAVFTKDNLRVKLEDLVDEGFISVVKEGKNTKYVVTEDIWKDFADEELKDIYFYMDFMKNTSPIEMPFYYLQRKLKLYLYSERGIDLDGAETLQLKHNHLFDSLDNDVLLQLMIAISNKLSVNVTVKNKDGESVESEIIPVQIIHDSIYGRQYILCIYRNNNESSIIRIDKIFKIEVGTKLSETELKFTNREELLNDSWSVSGLDQESKLVEIEFRFDEKTERYILGRVEKEGNGGKITKVEDSRYSYTIDCKDPGEMIPWIRSFGEHAVVINSGEYTLREKIKEDWERAVKKYEALS
ncbi:MAG: WYL domain-containing protein [Clostridia bacterium]|nr:WYL domain-containing protein [Clostridia bacterium]